MRVTNEGPVRLEQTSPTGIGGTTPPPEDCCDEDPADQPDIAENEDGLGDTSAWVLEEIAAGADDQNLAHGTDSNGAGATVGWANPTNANDGNSGTYAGINSGVYGSGTFTGYLVADLGATYSIEEHIFTGVSASGTDGLQAFGTWTVQYGPDGSTWNETGVTPTGGGAGVTTPVVFTLPSPVSARYWRAKMVMVTTGFHQGFELHTWAINGPSPIGTAWSLPAPEVIDADDATYVSVDGPDVVRIDLAAPYRIVRSRLRIGTATSGSKTYSIDAWNEVDESDRVTLSTFTFTGTGSHTAQDVEPTWFTDESYTWFELDGPSEERRVFSWELYEPTITTNHQHTAALVSYDPTASGLTADTVQEAIDELAGSVAVPALDDLTDVDTSGVSDGDVLTYDAGTSSWIADAPSGGGSGNGDLRIYSYDDGETSKTGTWALVATTTAPIYGSQLWGNTSTAQNDAMLWTRFLQAGTYTIQFRGVTNTDKPIITAKVDGSSVGTVDYYAGSLAYSRKVITGVVISTTGSHTFQVVMATKNGSSSAYGMAFSDIYIYRTA